MKTIDLYSLTPFQGRSARLSLPTFELRAHLIRLAWSTIAVATVVTLAAWALSHGKGATLGATLLTTGFLFLAVAVDRPDLGSFLRAALPGALLLVLALLGRYVASEFHLLGAAAASLAITLPWLWHGNREQP